MGLNDVRPDWKPVSGSKPRARGRKRATPADWRNLHAAKSGPCRVCGSSGRVELHHLFSRGQGGADTFDNLVPLCGHGGTDGCHALVEARDPVACRVLLESLSDGEYAFLVEVGGECVFERRYGLVYTR